MNEPLLTNARAEREWQWILRQVGPERAIAALEQLGNRKPYPVNVARLLGLELPSALTNDATPQPQSCAPSPEVQQRLKALQRRLSTTKP